MRALMLGAGFSPLRRRLLPPGASPSDEIEWTSIDNNPDANPTHCIDLNLWAACDNDSGYFASFHLNDFDEIHAYEVLEHIGSQGDYEGFFRLFRNLHRMLKPGGWLIGSTPSRHSVWVWGDPGHTRYIGPETLHFLTPEAYAGLGANTSSDYRKFVDPYWWMRGFEDYPQGSASFYFALQTVRVVG